MAVNEIGKICLRQGLATFPYHAYPFPFLRDSLPWLIRRYGWHGRLIVMPAFICPVVTEAVIRGGAMPALLDVDPDTWLLDLHSAPLPWDRVAAVIGVHTLGNPDAMEAQAEEVRRLAPQALFIEDAAHALFASRGDAPLAWSGDLVFMSLYKQLGYPFGGLVLSRTPWEDAPPEMPPGMDEGWFNGLEGRLAALQQEVAERSAALTPWIAQWQYGDWARLQRPLHPSWRPPGDLLSWEFTPEYAGTGREAVERLRARGVRADQIWWDAPVVSRRYQPYMKGACSVSRRLALRVVNVSVERGISAGSLQKIQEGFSSLLKV